MEQRIETLILRISAQSASIVLIVPDDLTVRKISEEL